MFSKIVLNRVSAPIKEVASKGAPVSEVSCIVSRFPGCGDYTAEDVSYLPDPCPLPEKLKKRSLDDKEKLIYAPMSGVGGVVFDKDAVYIDLKGSHSHNRDEAGEEDELLESLLQTKVPLDTKITRSDFTLLSGTQPLDKHRTEQ